MTEKQEIWKKIDGFSNYEVSNLGNVRSKLTGKVLRPSGHKDSYLHVILYKDSERKTFLVHRLVANAFIPNHENKSQVNHINGCKTDNYVSNLEWVSRSENQIHAYRLGLQIHNEKMGAPKKPVRCIETREIFTSQCEASRYFNYSLYSIQSSIKKGHKVKGKYHFELV